MGAAVSGRSCWKKAFLIANLAVLSSATAENLSSTNVALLSPSFSNLYVSSVNVGLNSEHVDWDTLKGRLQGWDHLAAKLVDAGVSVREVAETLSDPRMPPRSDLIFSLDPRESKALYRKHNTKANRNLAMQFFNRHRPAFRYASERFLVPEGVILAILQIETACGRNTGRSRVIPGSCEASKRKRADEPR